MLKFATMSFHAIRPPSTEVYESVEKRMLNIVRGSKKKVGVSGTFVSKYKLMKNVFKKVIIITLWWLQVYYKKFLYQMLSELYSYKTVNEIRFIYLFN